ncbi:Co2+/Mg2+ efflux protein ApaG [Rhodospirillum rubrum]|uniref:Protein ApaG n=1 Tax=Rhodospirillum rubrum (strain ATCC 11170 / ATH 1.1.1 / DSM 467 / LMG 4362 / NCIMB 8255 / S1) TaxID=269796 RepID=Q2RXS0_RHORT|nr:Co2+/Mg2+ efflux protein ApaG [Rhodospirillum rubrum]ABC21075.1 Protein of unknown function DUF525 [Rhodospirillum rubrum ATCC 11170]AEO46743.1 CO2+/MG2+ efflux protein ApaG [Rhodospirillum rubrum F11]MBK5952619.1 Co2+/Mg2+ efflux protein ApaG [Rhodospirillum rubrum]QXG80767.1 Co2+/Mg2+ efflux protein ApaG [Rhodospirillum rubrum]HAP99093.1 Co2+/Mg2+ efflux protein ApaG [Rhodospirillum rubrum]
MTDETVYERTTEGITVRVLPIFLDEQSEPERGHYLWAYQVLIVNRGARTVQLMRRHWIVTDAFGRVQEVEGEGVVGEQPILAPGAQFDYTSGTPLPTPSGFMGGSYLMRDDTGRELTVAIPTFSLNSPESAGHLH